MFKRLDAATDWERDVCNGMIKSDLLLVDWREYEAAYFFGFTAYER